MDGEIIMSTRNRIKYFSFFIFILSLKAACVETPSINTDGDFEFSKKEKTAIERGNQIIEALGNYYADNGYYPNKLEELRPKYIKRIPRTGLWNLFSFSVPFQYYPEPMKYREGCFSIRFLNYDDKKNYHYYSISDSFEKDKFINKMDDPDLAVLDKVTFEDVKILASAIKKYYSDKKIFPDKLEDLIPDYLTAIPFPLTVRYTVKSSDKIWNDYVSYSCQQPLSDDESEFPLYYRIRFRYNFDEEYRYSSSDNEWVYFPH